MRDVRRCGATCDTYDDSADFCSAGEPVFDGCGCPDDTVLASNVSRHSAISARLDYTDTGYGHQRTSLQQFYNLSYNKFTTNGQKFATSQYLDVEMLDSGIARCDKFVVELL